MARKEDQREEWGQRQTDASPAEAVENAAIDQKSGGSHLDVTTKLVSDASLDRRTFVIDDADASRLAAILAAPPPAVPALRRLMRAPSPWS